MGFEIRHLRRGNTGLRQRRLYHPPLRGTVRHCQAAPGTVLVHGRTTDHCQDAVAVAFGVREALQHDHPAALAASIAIRRGIEGLASPVRRQHPRAAGCQHTLYAQDQVHAAGERRLAFAGPQGQAGLMHGNQ